MDNSQLIDAVQYGEAFFEDTKRALAIIPREILDTGNRGFDKADVLTQWCKYSDRIFLSVFWPEAKKGLIFPFDRGQKRFIRLIIRKKSLAVGNPSSKKKLLVLDILKKEPLEWMRKKLF